MKQTTLKRRLTEPKVYALVIKVNQNMALYTGVHFSLEEAYTAARRRNAARIGKSSNDTDHELWMWEIMSIQAINDLSSPQEPIELKEAQKIELTSDDMVGQLSTMKNDLMKKIIDTKDKEMFDKAKSMFSDSEQRLILDRLVSGEK